MASASKVVQGYLLAATRGIVTGWAWAPSIDDRVEVEVMVDGERAGDGRAQIFSDRLRRAGLGDGAHGFAIALPERLRDYANHRVGVVALGGCVLPTGLDFVGASPVGDPWYGTSFAFDRELEASRQASPKSGANGLLGLLETVRDGRAFGWAYDPGSPWQRIELEVIVDDELVAETVADLSRPSLIEEGIGDGRHGFVVELPSHLCDDGAHAISIRLPSGEALPLAQSFEVTASDALEWAETTFSGTEAGVPTISSLTLASKSPRPDGQERPGLTAKHVNASSSATTLSPNASRSAARLQRLRPCDDLLLPRRSLREGFSGREGPETVVLGAEMTVAVDDRLHLAVQPGVADPLAERRMRFGSPSYSVPRLLASRLPNAIVDTRSFLIMPTENRYLVESVRHRAVLARWGYELFEDGAIQRELDEIPEREERVVVLGAQSNVNYSHWLIESIVRVLLFRPLDDGTRLYLTPPLADWQRETLELVGVGADRIIELEPQGPVRFREAISVSRGMGGLPAIRPAGVVALAELAPPSIERRRIYCSRAVARYRHVTNEAEMVELLTRHGFELVCPETLSIREQIATFASAEVVFALHGSGLTNIVFSPPGTTVIELQAEGFSRGGA
ncbi:MAG TPA: glycosyltransferase family 61 protein, partial [Solirubrobacteraceae bacterium]|nr:glycosyltransferase family 61 protein [Solirubrobacteraceae bacterium]